MGCCNKTKGKTPSVRIGTDTIFSVVLFRRNGSLGMSQAPEEKDVIDPRMLASIEAEIRNEFGESEVVATNIDGKLLKLEVTKELTQRMGLGLYRLGLRIREADARFTDGYRDITLASELCQVVSDGAEAGQANTEISVAIAQLPTGKSAYQHYLDTTTDTPKKTLQEWLASFKGEKGDSAYQSYLNTTTDNPKMTEEEWAAGGWLVVLEMLKKLRKSRR